MAPFPGRSSEPSPTPRSCIVPAIFASAGYCQRASQDATWPEAGRGWWRCTPPPPLAAPSWQAGPVSCQHAELCQPPAAVLPAGHRPTRTQAAKVARVAAVRRVSRSCLARWW
jgi:hypothetical protein